MQCSKTCNYVLKDERSLKEYFVYVDSCNTYNGFKSVKYFSNDGFSMTGYNDRLSKQGRWKYFRKDDVKAEGNFKNGNPIGLWKFKDFENCNWKIVEDEIDGYVIYLPNYWSIIENKKLSLLAVYDKNNIEAANVNIVVSTYETSISGIIKADNKSLLLNQDISELEVKKLYITNFDEVYQRKYKINYEGLDHLVFQSIYGRKNMNKVYTLTVNSVYNEYNDYFMLFEPIVSSLKFYDK